MTHRNATSREESHWQCLDVVTCVRSLTTNPWVWQSDPESIHLQVDNHVDNDLRQWNVTFTWAHMHSDKWCELTMLIQIHWVINTRRDKCEEAYMWPGDRSSQQSTSITRTYTQTRKLYRRSVIDKTCCVSAVKDNPTDQHMMCEYISDRNVWITIRIQYW